MEELRGVNGEICVSFLRELKGVMEELRGVSGENSVSYLGCYHYPTALPFRLHGISDYAKKRILLRLWRRMRLLFA